MAQKEKMAWQRGRNLAPFTSWLFVLIILQTALWPLLVTSEHAFELLPYHEHLYLHENAHTVHIVHEVDHHDHLGTFAAAPWSHTLGEGALCIFNLFAAQQAGILLPESLSALVAALSVHLLLIATPDEQHTITTLFFPPPDQPPRS